MSVFNLPYEEQICIDNIVYMEVLLEKHIHNLEVNISNINSTDINLLNELILKLTCLIEFKHTDLDNAKLEKVVNLKWNIIKENYKNNVGCIIFMVLVYSEIMMESCLSYEKTVNDCRSFYE